MEIEAECQQFAGHLLAEPISQDDYAEILRVRKSSDYHTRNSEEWVRWATLVCRFQRQYPTTPERTASHEAGHIVVGHKLGWDAQWIDRHPDGTPHAFIRPPCEPPALPMIDWATTGVAGWIAESISSGMTDPTEEVSGIAREFRAYERGYGRNATVWDRIRFIQRAEARAREILQENWEAVERISAIALVELPVQREVLLDALAGVVKDTPRCGRVAGNRE